MTDETKPKTAEEVLADMWEYFTTPGMSCGAPYPERHETVFEKFKEREDLWGTQLAAARAGQKRSEQTLIRLHESIERLLVQDRAGWPGICGVDLNIGDESGVAPNDARVLTVPDEPE